MAVTRPIEELQTLERLSTGAGETKTVTFTLTPGTFRMLNIAIRMAGNPLTPG
jgi:hypothetical protein